MAVHHPLQCAWEANDREYSVGDWNLRLLVFDVCTLPAPLVVQIAGQFYG